MHETPFYITLPSDASMDQYPANTAADWTTKLKSPITLRGKWEVALVEMQYVNSLYTFPKTQKMMIRQIVGIKDESDPEKVEPVFEDHEIVFQAGHWGSADVLIGHINSNIPKLKRLQFLESNSWVMQKSFVPNGAALQIELFSPTDHRLRVTFGAPTAFLVFPPDSTLLQRVLGFDQSEIYARMDKVKQPEHVKEILAMYVTLTEATFPMVPVVAPRPLNPFLGRQTLIVYSDIADYVLMGDSSSQVLRTVSIKGQFMELVTERFDIPHYTPVLMTHFETININISTDLGDTAKFATGKSLIKLHFRPQRPY